MREWELWKWQVNFLLQAQVEVLQAEVRVKRFSHTTQVAEGERRDKENEEPSTVEDNHVWDCLRNLKVHESVGPDDTHPWVLREWAE